MNTQKQILDFLEAMGRPVTPHELIGALKKSNVSIHKNLKSMLILGLLEKIGSAPKIYYRLTQPEDTPLNSLTPDPYIEQEFTFIDPVGNEHAGSHAFQIWCKERNLDETKMRDEYLHTHQSYMQLKHDGLIDATTKIQSTFTEKKLDHLFFLYPHSIPVFGKTKVATLLFHGKQVQDKKLIERVLEIVVPEILSVVKNGMYDAIAFVPPTVPRALQFMTELQKKFTGMCIILPIEKIFNDIRIQQKSLKDVFDRVKNAENTFVVPIQNTTYNKVLIIDDFTGSGATLNVLAGMFKKQHIASLVDGLTITGSMNGFEVIKEM